MNAIQRLGMRLLGLKTQIQVGQTGTIDGPPVHVAGYQDGRLLITEWDAKKAVKEGLKSNTWVYAACSKVARGLSSVPFVLKRRNGEHWEAQPDHPIQKLLNRPNPYMARQDVQERWAYHLLLSGNALLYKNLVDGVPVELWPLLPEQVQPIPSRVDYLAGYFWRPSPSDRLVLQPEQVAHFQLADPSNPYWGLSPLQAAAQAVDTDTAAASWNRKVLGNDGRPPYAIMLDKQLTAAQQESAHKLLGDQLDGNNVRKFLLLGAATKVQPLSLNSAELDFLNSRRFTREEIGSAFGVPGILLYAGEGITYANLEAAKVLLWEDTILPLLMDFTQGLQTSLFPHWQLNDSEWKIDPDLSQVRALQANLKTTEEARKLKAEAAKTYIDAGFPVNMVNRVLNLGFDDVEGGDLPRAPAPAPVPAVKSRQPRMERKDKTADEQLARADEWTAELKKKVAATLGEQGNTLAAAYADGELDKAVDLTLDDWDSLLQAAHTAVIESEGEIAFTALAKALTVGGAFDTLDANVTGWIEDHVGEAVKGITQTTREVLAGVVKAGVSDGLGSKEIAKNIRGQFSDWSKSRAELIARTEVSTAMGAAHQLTAEQIVSDSKGQVEIVKTWVSAQDSRVRDEHSAMDGETVDLADSFSNGLDYPSEPNCRCVVTYAEKGA